MEIVDVILVEGIDPIEKNGELIHERLSVADFAWVVKQFGFGHIVFYYDENEVLRCDNECMNKDFIKQILCAFVDKAILDSDRKDFESKEDTHD